METSARRGRHPLLMGARAIVRKKDCAIHIIWERLYAKVAATMGVQMMLSTEECAAGMEQRSSH
jgi:hypothetical protein